MKINRVSLSLYQISVSHTTMDFRVNMKELYYFLLLNKRYQIFIFIYEILKRLNGSYNNHGWGIVGLEKKLQVYI